MAITWSKILSLVIATGYFITAMILEPRPDYALLLLLALLFPLGLIWFAEKIGTSWPRKKSSLGYYEPECSPWPHPAMRDSPPRLVAFMGWLFLLGLPALYFWLNT